MGIWTPSIFGVVLFEVLCARSAVDMGLDYDRQGLAYWASLCFEEGKLDQIIGRCTQISHINVTRVLEDVCKYRI